MPFFTGTDTTGVIVAGNNQNWFTLQGTTVSHTGSAFQMLDFNNVTYTVLGTVISDTDAITSGSGAAGNAVFVGSTGVVWGESDGIELRGTGHRIENEGEIYGLFDAGIQLFSSGDTNGAVVNHGSITASRGIVVEGGNQITNTGTVMAQFRGVDLAGANNVLLNTGTIVSEGIAVYSSVGGVPTAGQTVNNFGLIATLSTAHDRTAIESFGSAAMVVVNHGTIDGNVSFGNADDVFEAAGGTLNGAISAGGGTDRLILSVVGEGTIYQFDGGDGSDTVDFSGFDHAIWLDLAYGGSDAWTKDSHEASAGVADWRELADLTATENIVGTVGIDYLYGNDSDNTFGYVGTNLIAGVEEISGRGGSDTVDFSRFDSAVWVDLGTSGVEAWTKDMNDAQPGTGTWRQIADFDSIENLVGTVGIDFFYGNASDNTFGYVGTSQIAGVEQIFGYGGTDTVDFSRFESAVWVDLSTAGVEAWTKDMSDAQPGTGNWRQIADLDSIENLVGSDHDDWLIGDSGANVIRAGAGDDMSQGQSGADTFEFEDGFGNDTIIDFEANDAERIDLSGVSSIVNFNDLMVNHLSDVGGTATITDANGNTITLSGWQMINFGAGNPISEDDFIF